MSTRRFLRALLVGLLVVLALLPATTHAAAPIHTNFSGTQPGVDVCGLTVTVAFKGVDNFSPVFNSSGNLIAFKDTHEEKDVFTAANGKSVLLSFANQVTASFTTNPDGSLTVVTTYKGLPEKISTPNGPVLTRDAGLITFVDLFDSSGNFISETTGVESGPHPEADSGFALFCQTITAALT